MFRDTKTPAPDGFVTDAASGLEHTHAHKNEFIEYDKFNS